MHGPWIDWLNPVRALAAEASERILAIYVTAFDVTAKDDNSPLTAADLASHHTIVAGLRELTPDIPVLSEESAALPFAQRQAWRRYWLVDPLDGTKEFVKAQRRVHRQYCPD
jgi:3'(2'), 5'-bisphosphate nucleotidase